MVVKNNAKYISVLALFCALVCAGKLALEALPNIEVVTLLIAVAASVFGVPFALTVVLVFCLEQSLIFGFNTWLFSYIIHFSVIALLFGLLPKQKSPWWYCLAATIATLGFGVLTSVVDTILAFDGSFIVNFNDFFYRFGILYLRGVVFFAIHTFSNAVLFRLCFVPINNLTNRLKLKMFSDEYKNCSK